MKNRILVVMMLLGAVALSSCSSCNPCAGTCAPSDCSGTNSYTGNWY